MYNGVLSFLTMCKFFWDECKETNSNLITKLESQNHNVNLFKEYFMKPDY